MPQNAAGTFALSGKYVIPKRITAHLKNSWWVTIELTVNVHLGRATSVQDVLQYNVICVHTPDVILPEHVSFRVTVVTHGNIQQQIHVKNKSHDYHKYMTPIIFTMCSVISRWRLLQYVRKVFNILGTIVHRAPTQV